MLKPVASLVCCVLAAVGFGLLRHAPPERSHDDWLHEKYLQATSVKEGMTRADLLKLFVMDGGIQPGVPTRYVLKSSRMIKVDVEFDVPDAVRGQFVTEDGAATPADASKSKTSPRGGFQVTPDEQLKIKSISRPYLEPFYTD